MTTIAMGWALCLALAQGAPPQPPPQQPPVIVPVAAPLYPQPGPAPEIPPSTATVSSHVAESNPYEPVVKDDGEAVSVRISDLVTVEGHRSNQLAGVGLVTGLNGTGDKGAAARQALSNFIRAHDLNVSAKDVDIANVAFVSLTATLPPDAKEGTLVPVSIQAMNGATSLFGGYLLQAPLRGADNEVYVVAQGSIVVGAFAASGKSASVQQNHPTTGTLSDGGIVEREVRTSLIAADGTLHLHLRAPSFGTATRIAREIMKSYSISARALDSSTVRVALPPEHRDDVVAFLGSLDQRFVAPAEEAVVVVNERTGTIVAGSQVRISTMLVTQGNLTISVSESPQTSQPNSFGSGETQQVDRTSISADVEKRGLQVVKGGASVSDLATSLNRMGVAPRDLIAIFQTMARAGYLHARLEIQ